MTDISSVTQLIVQGGALGILAVGLWYAYKYLKHVQLQTDSKDAEMMSFLKGLVTTANEQQNTFQEAWRQMATDASVQQASVASVLGGIEDSLATHTKESTEEHKEIIQRLYVMNGKNSTGV